MKFLLVPALLALSTNSASAAFFTSNAPERSNVDTGPAEKYNYDMEPPAGASKKCALINVVMDESGSMTTEQNFMRTTALPEIVRALYTPTYGYSDVFVCSNGFGAYLNTDDFDYRHIGCAKGATNGAVDSSLTDWQTYGHWEDGYYAMSKSMENLPKVIDIQMLTTQMCAKQNLLFCLAITP